MNQRVLSTTITFKPPATQITLTVVTIDGIEVLQDFNKPITKIQISGVFKYQDVVKVDD
jgi:hypothetical protein